VAGLGALLGYLVTVMAMVALVSPVTGDARLLVWPGAVVLGAGAIVAALASAFYYHFAAWGAVEMADRSEAERSAHVASLRVPTEYVTCLTRFGPVFYGLGQLVLALGLLQIALLPAWLAIVAAALGALTMGLPDELERFRPIFHLNAVWLLGVGIVLLTRAPPG
jgi:hypothetical protein